MRIPTHGRIPNHFVGLGVAGLVVTLATVFLIGCKPHGGGSQNSIILNPDEIKLKAEHSDPEAQTTLGMMYAKGLSVTQSYKEAANWYRRAAAQGHPPAQNSLGELCEVGQGVPRDEAEAASWYRKAAEKGYAPAQYNLAVLYTVGRGVAMDATEAMAWYRRAANQGDSLAQYNLGMRFFEGNGVTQNFTVAYQWLSLAAAQKIPDAEKARNQLKKSMSPDQLTEGRRRVNEFVPKRETTLSH